MRETTEKVVTVRSGWEMLGLNVLVLLGSLGLLIAGPVMADATGWQGWFWLWLPGWLACAAGIISCCGHFTLQPNEARVLILFGEYRGTVRESGFFWTNPFYVKRRLSMRARNFDGATIKVNDKRGNPIDISAVVVWRISDTAKAVFDVDDHEHFVQVQSLSALRHLASAYPYDHGDDAEHPSEITLRSGTEEIGQALQREVQARLTRAGVTVDEARLNHLAYSPEIAQAMLRRQQAEAVIAARKKIVHGAVSMVEMALRDLEAQKVVELDPERRAAMVSNLLVVLCGETEAHPVINAGTLYN